MKKIIVFFENNFIKSGLILLLSTLFSVGILGVTLVLSCFIGSILYKFFTKVNSIFNFFKILFFSIEFIFYLI